MQHTAGVADLYTSCRFRIWLATRTEWIHRVAIVVRILRRPTFAAGFAVFLPSDVSPGRL